jgi:hypothetical protein
MLTIAQVAGSYVVMASVSGVKKGVSFRETNVE